MAGIYILGIEMPNGGTIKIEIGYDADGHPMAMTEDYNAYDVIPVPPHGRLIDADATLKLLRNLGSRDYRREKGTIMDAMKMLSYDEYTPTIIPAEEG